MRQSDRGARDRDGDGVAPRGGRLARASAARATRRRWTCAALLYKKVAEAWTSDEFSKFEFPRLVKEDWPTIYKIKYDMADLLYFREKWAECGPAFDAVVQEDPKAPEAAEAAYAAVLCYQNIYLAQHAKGSDKKGSGNLPGVGKDIKQDEDAKYRPKDMTDAQKSMVSSFNRYVCYIHPKPEDADGQKQLAEVQYARCRLYFEAQHWEEAAACFKDVAYDHPENDAAVYAAQLYLESINVLTFHGSPNRNSCLDDMITDVPKFLDLFCTGDKAAKNEDTCTLLTKVQCDIQRLRAQRIVEEADKGGNNALELFEKGGNAYFALWDKYGATPLRANQPPQCERLDEIVENAARAFQAGHLVASAIRARMVLLNPTYRMEKSELAKDAEFKIGGNYQAIAVYDQAADLFEHYAKDNPMRQERRQGALRRDRPAARPRPRGQSPSPTSKQYQKDYGNSNANETAQIAFAIGAHYADKEDWESTRKALTGAMGDARQGTAGHPGPGARHARSRLHASQGRKSGQAEYDKSASSGATAATVQPRLTDAYKGEGEDQTRPPARQGARRRGRGAFFFGRRREEEGEGRSVALPRLQGRRQQGRRSEVHGQVGKTLGTRRSRPRSKKVDKEYSKDHRSSARPAAAVGHRGRFARRAHVGQLRRRVPSRALSPRSGTRRASSPASATRYRGPRSCERPEASTSP